MSRQHGIEFLDVLGIGRGNKAKQADASQKEGTEHDFSGKRI